MTLLQVGIHYGAGGGDFALVATGIAGCVGIISIGMCLGGNHFTAGCTLNIVVLVINGSTLAGGVAQGGAFGFATDGAGLGCGAGCIVPAVAQSFAFGCLTDGAGLGRGAGCVIPGVALGGNGSLSDGDFTADRTVLAFGQAGSSTGCSNSLVDNLGVPQSVDGSLGDNNCITDGAMLTFGQAGCR